MFRFECPPPPWPTAWPWCATGTPSGLTPGAGTRPLTLWDGLGLDPQDRPPILEAQPTAWDCFAGGRRPTTVAECITRKLTLAVAVYAGTDADRAQPLVMLPVLASSTVLDAAHRAPDLNVFILDGIARVLPIRRVRLNVPIRVGPDDRWVWGATKAAPPADPDPGPTASSAPRGTPTTWG